MNLEKTPEERRLDDVQALINRHGSVKLGELPNITGDQEGVLYSLTGKPDGSYTLLVTDANTNKKYLFRVNNQGTLTEESAWDIHPNENTGKRQQLYTQTPREVDVKFDDLLMGL